MGIIASGCLGAPLLSGQRLHGRFTMAAPNDFFTLQSLGTFAGATGATTVIANAIRLAFGLNQAWVALAVAEAICLGVVLIAYLDAAPGVPVVYSAYFIAFLNGFLVFCTAASVTALGVQGEEAMRGGAATHRIEAKYRAVRKMPDSSGYIATSPAENDEGSSEPPRRFFTRWF
jgi:hypothetical protein